MITRSDARKLKNKQISRLFARKKGIEMGFAWIFAIIAGAFILFLAIYAAINFISISQTEISTKTAKVLSIILDPMETSLESGKKAEIELIKESRIYNTCKDLELGKNEIQISEKSGWLKEWPEPGGAISVHNKYIFSSSIEQGKKFNVISLSFNLPFKISDILLLMSKDKEFCLVQAPEFVKENLEALNLDNVNFSFGVEDCRKGSEKICFSSLSGCNKTVYGTCLTECENEFDYGYVSDGKKIYYSGNLLYAAIFSSKEVYECNVKRLMRRLGNLCLLYKDKAEILARENCHSTLTGDLLGLANLANNLNSSQNLFLVQDTAKRIKETNEAASCKLF